MTTSLQRQLAALATPASSLLVPDRKVSSILFTPQEAARHKRDEFYEIGLDGLYELIKVNPDLFKKFLTSPLFDESSKRHERIVEDREANQRLDELLEEFLISLSPYIMLKASLKCLEWLVNRFHIEKFNVELIMGCIIPYFDTKQFSLVIQVLDVKRDDRWHWIFPNVQTALPVNKNDLYAHCNAAFLVWIFSTFYKYIHYHENRLENLRVFISFMTLTFNGVLARLNMDLHNTNHQRMPKVRNLARAIITCLWSQLAKLSSYTAASHDRLKKGNEEIQAMICIISTGLFNLTSAQNDLQIESQDDVQTVMTNVLTNHPRSLKTQAYLLVNLLSSAPKNNVTLPKKMYLRRALNEISLLSSDWDLWHLSSKLILNHVFKEKFKFGPKKIWSIITSINFTIQQRSELFRKLYARLRSPKRPKKFRQWKKKFLARCEREYPLEFELASKEDSEFAATFAKITKGKNLMLLAQHPSMDIRLEAVRKLLRNFKLLHCESKEGESPAKKAEFGKKVSLKVSKKKKKTAAKAMNKKKIKIPKPDENKTATALLPRFKDDSDEIVHFLVRQNVSLLSKVFSLKTLVEQLEQVITRRDPQKTCVKVALRQLCRIAEMIELNSKSLKGEERSLIPKIFTILLPFLFPTTPFKLKMCQIILNSEYAKRNSYLKTYAKYAKKEGVKAQEICDFSYDTITWSLEGRGGRGAGGFPTWNPNFSTVVSTVFTILTWNSAEKIETLLDVVNKMDLKPISTSWNLTKRNFQDCLRLAFKKQALSLELLFTTLFRLNLSNSNDIQRVVEFVLQKCEQVENRNVCGGFMKEFLNKQFPNPNAHLQFWTSIIVHVRKRGAQKSPQQIEFLTLRFLQCCCFLLKELSTREELGKSAEAGGRDLLETILALCLDHDSSRIRVWGLNCMEKLADVCNEEESKFAAFVHEYRDEIIADKEQLPIIIAKALQMEEFTQVRDRFIKVIIDEPTEEVISTGLLKMFRFASSTIFKQFTPVAKELLQTDSSSKKLLAVLNCFDGSLTELSSFDVLCDALKHKEPCLVMLSKMTPAVFESYTEVTKKKLIALLIDTVLFSKVPEIKVIIQRRVRKWILDATLISAELDKCIRMEKLLNSGANTPAKKQTRRASAADKGSSSHSVFGEIEWTNRTEVVLEFVQAKKRLRQRSKLILPLFKLLKICILLEEQSPVEYLKQLILTTLTLCCDEDEGEGKSNMEDWIHFNVETVIDCLRCSRNPQTHHHALILLNYSAKKYPEQVLHGVMSLFTFMGNSILRQDDSYSTQLIQQTVRTIIPTLANETSARQFSKDLVSAGILRVFTGAVQHIPIHRRVPVFVSLVETLDPKQAMWQVCVIIVDHALMRDKKRSHLNADMELATDIAWHFSPEIVLDSVAKVYTYLMGLPIFEKHMTEEKYTRLKNTQEPHSKSLIDLSRKETLRDAEIIVLFTVELLSKICDKFIELDEHQKPSYDTLLQKCLSMARLVSTHHEDKIMRLLGARNMEVIEKINAALDPSEFISATRAILLADDNAVKKKMLDLLNQRILHQIEWFKNQKLLLDLIPHLVNLANANPESDDQVTLIQTALLSLKLISRHLATLHPEEFVPVFELASEHIRHKNKLLRASGLLCLGELFSLKALILPKLAEVCSSITKAFKASMKLNTKTIALASFSTAEATEVAGGEPMELDQETETSITTANLLCISAITCLNKLVEQLGPFLGSQFLQKVLLSVFSIDEIFGHGTKSETRKKVFDQRLKTLLKTISTKIPLRTSIIIFKQVFIKLEGIEDYDSRAKSMLLLIGLFKETLLVTSKSDFNTLLPSICELFLEQILIHREKVTDELDDAEQRTTTEKLEEVEDACLDCLVTGIILKMSEGLFRPFYHKIFDWASDSLPRLITFYRLSTMAAERLKSLFVTFAGIVIHEGAKRLTEDATLTRAILSYFYQIFLHDREGFVTIERFNALVKPLVDLIESEFLLSDQVTIQQLNETMIQLAVASNDLNRWQHMIDLLSLKTRHENPKVRLFVISTIETAATELGKDFLPLLPPAVPFLAEMLNDDDSRVEKETRRMLAKLEELLGEPLQPYFTV